MAGLRTHPDAQRARHRYWLVEKCKDVWADHFTRTADGASRYANKHQRTEINYGTPIQRGRLIVQDGRIRKRTRKLGICHPEGDPWAAPVLSQTHVY